MRRLARISRRRGDPLPSRSMGLMLIRYRDNVTAMRESRAFALLCSLSVGSFAFALERSAAAIDCTDRLTSTCINSDTLWPHAGPSRFLTIGGTETVAPRHIGFGLLTSYQ